MNRRGFSIILGSLMLAGYASTAFAEKEMSEPVVMSPRLQKLFAKTKQVCFGRYVMEVPAEAELLWGFQEFPGKIITHVGEAKQLKAMAEAYRTKILAENKTAEITFFGPGSTSNSIQVRYFRSKNAKQFGNEGGWSFVAAGPHLFEWSGARTIAEWIPKLRARDSAEIPTAPGVCIDHGFIADAAGSDQEIFGAGIDLPSLPDVSFSILSNKDASTDGDPGLIERHYSAMGKATVPGVTRLQLGKREVNGWKGEQVLLRRNGIEKGVFAHEFLWASIGKSGSALNPASVDIQLNTGVKANRTLGQSSSLTDEEALALWNRLQDSVRFRVNAPPTQTGAPVTVRSGEPTPLDGMWRPSLPPEHPMAAWVASQSSVRWYKGRSMIRAGLPLPQDEALVVWTWMGESNT
ncbi:T6SS immunity protein Tli4 family protein [Ralstonia sp. UBA689]|uniref:T6SS immunity protein Tli4 family protein n=1 Tax=Ralstonia sp. UBA689 TaxID=1947373 RepID=UPI0025CEC746|nr:T6SS immunity protein Tli4 family protein [Ralstonia sp. UBA689]